MLRVITEQQGDTCRLELHGRLGGEWVPMLEQHWRGIVGTPESAKVTVVLSNVNFIDAEGERLLKRMADRGAEFVVEGCLNRYVIEKLQPKCACDGRMECGRVKIRPRHQRVGKGRSQTGS